MGLKDMIKNTDIYRLNILYRLWIKLESATLIKNCLVSNMCNKHDEVIII